MLTKYPIALMRISNYLMTWNSKALKLVGSTAVTPDPGGRRIQRKPGDTEPNGD